MEHWICDVNTVQPDITAHELVQILRFIVHIPDSLMGDIKANGELLRHFRRVIDKS